MTALLGGPRTVAFMCVTASKPGENWRYRAFVLETSYALWKSGPVPQPVEASTADDAVAGLKKAIRSSLGQTIRFEEY